MGDEVEVNLVIKSSHTEQVDIRENFVFTLGRSELLPPIEASMVGLSEGENKTVSFPIAPYYRTEEGAKMAGFHSLSEILTAEISVLVVTDTAQKASGNILAKEELLAIANTKKMIGNDKLKAREITEATLAYSEGISVLRSLGGEWPSTGGLRDERRTLEITLLSNLAQAHILIGNFYEAIKAASEAIAIDSTAVKAWFRRGLANRKFGELRKARSDILQAAKLEPANPEIRKLLDEISAEIKVNDQELKTKLAL